MSFTLKGKSAIVTGAASGLGLAVARHLVDAGANVLFFDTNEELLLQEVGDQVEEGGPVQLYTGDICKKLAIANLVSSALDHFDRIDILVNASRLLMQSDPYKLDDKSVGELFDHNVLATLRLSQYVANRMVKQNEEDGGDALKGGAIINLFSQVGRTNPELLGYAMSTAAVEQMTRSLAVAYAPENVRVNGVSFASVMSVSLGEALREDDGLREKVISNTPLGRIARPNEICGAVQYLASDEASFVTGEVITVDGGRAVFDGTNVAAH